jgi:hypothetical protein
VGAFYRTLKTVFPQVYLFPARTSKNVVLLATKAAIKVDVPGLRARAAWLTQTQRVRLPAFRERLESMLVTAPPNSLSSPILTDDFAPVEGLAAAGGKN